MNPDDMAAALMGGPEAMAPAMEQMAGTPPVGAPAMGGVMGAPDPAMDPAMGGMGAPAEMDPGSAMFPSLDPAFLMSIVEQIKGVQEADLAKMTQEQDTVLAAVLEMVAGMGGAPQADPSLGVTEGAAFGAPEGPLGEAPTGY